MVSLTLLSGQLGKTPFRDRQVSVRNPAGAIDLNLFSLLVEDLTGDRLPDRQSFSLLDLLGLLPGVHRTFCKVAASSPMFCPIEELAIFGGNRSYWLRIALKESERDVIHTKSRLLADSTFRNSFSRVQARTEETGPATVGQMWFETGKHAGWGRSVPRAFLNLKTVALRNTFVPLITNVGYRYYLALHDRLRNLAGVPAMYMIMFYLSSITRYQPYHFDAIFSGGFRWLVNEFLETQPQQFVYLAGSLLAETEVVRPFGGTLTL